MSPRWLPLVALVAAAPSQGQQVVFTPLGGAFTMATDIQQAAGDGVLYVSELAGFIQVLENATVRPTPLLDISGLVTQTGELGLLGFTFDPQWPSSPYVYVRYGRNGTGSAQYQTVVSRFTVDPTSRVADAGSQEILFVAEQPNGWHAAGAIAFGADGYLYVSQGEGGEPDQAQSLASHLGSILRLDVRGNGGPLDCATSGTATVPAGNPFVDGPGGSCDEIFAYGFRNPWRISVDAPTGDVWVGDVGDFEWEEVDIVHAGQNYGWPIMEGGHCHFSNPSCDQEGLTLPVWEYARAPGQAVVGGHVYRGTSIPDLAGQYVFGDLATSAVWALRDTGSGWTATQLGTNPGGGQLSTFGRGNDEALYTVPLFGQVRRIDDVSVSTPASPESSPAIELAGPNPFDSRTAVRITPAAAGPARVEVLDALGRTVATALDRHLEAGQQVVVPIDGSGLAPGVYMVRLRAAGTTHVIRLALSR